MPGYLRCVLFGFALALLAGCASTHAVDVVYYDLSPSVVGATVYSESQNATGLNAICVDRYMIDRQGHCVCVSHEAASGAAPLPAFLSGIGASSSANTVTGAVIGAMDK